MSDTPSGAYVIDEDYTIVSFNDTIKGLYPQLEVGGKCHRRLSTSRQSTTRSASRAATKPSPSCSMP